VRFRINWGTRDGADPRRILAHVCRRGGIDGRLIGAIDVHVAMTTFGVAAEAAAEFERRALRPDRREPHLIISRDRFGKHGPRH
jgi:ATP-dependent RNA helicase DeaD